MGTWILTDDIVDPASGEILWQEGAEIQNDTESDTYQWIDAIAHEIGLTGAGDLLSRVAWYIG